MERHGVSVDELEVLRGPLNGFCYRLLGSAADTDDAVQETIIRAYCHRERFDPTRAGLSTWVHAIAANVCIDMLRAARRRELLAPVTPGAPGDDLGAPLPADSWLEPMPDSRVVHAADPADHAVQRESVRLAFLAALQLLDPRPRAVLVLRDVYAFTARETADALDMTVAAANSTLQRARAKLAAHRDLREHLNDPDDPAMRDLLHRYMDAFQAHDVEAMRSVLHADAISSMPPFAWWLAGRDHILAAFGASDGCVGDRLLPITVNATIGFAQYRPADDGVLRPFAVTALDVRDGLVAHAVTFIGTGSRFAEFGLPDSFSADHR